MKKIQRLIDVFWLPSLFCGLGVFASIMSLYIFGHQVHLDHPNYFGLVLLAICYLATNGSRHKKLRIFYSLSGILLSVLRIWWFFSTTTPDIHVPHWSHSVLWTDASVLPMNFALGAIGFYIVHLIQEIYESPRDRRIWLGVTSVFIFSYVTIGALRIFFKAGEGFFIYSLARVEPIDAVCIQALMSYYIFRAWISFYKRWAIFRISLIIATLGGMILAIAATGIEKEVYTLTLNQMERKVIDIQAALKKNVDERLSIISIFGDFLNTVPNPTEAQIYGMMNKLNSSGVEAPAVFFFNQHFELKWIYQDGQFLWGQQAEMQLLGRRNTLIEYLQNLDSGKKYLAQTTSKGHTVSFSSPLLHNKKLEGYLIFEDYIQPRIQLFFSKNDFGPFNIFVTAADGSPILNSLPALAPAVYVKSNLDFLDESLNLMITPNRALAVNTVFIPQISFAVIGLLIIVMLVYTIYVNRQRVREVEKEVQERVQELKIMKEEADRAKMTAEHASYSKSQFLANMSHEIRTPLNVLLGASELLSETKLNTDQKKYVEMFQNSGKHLLGLLNDIIDLSRIESGQLETEKISFDLLKTLEFVRSLFLLKAQEQGLQFTVNTSGITQAIRIGDPLRIRQILVNLIGNSFKFTKSGSISLSVSQGSEDKIIFKVEDTGSGIPTDKQKEIFETFQQGDVSFSRKHGGAGLGLAISKNLCELMGGKISLQSRPGVGSQFTVTIPLPLGDASKARIEPVEFSPDSVNLEIASKPSIDSKKILLVDDSDDNRFLVKLFLENSPYEVTEARNGEEAVDLVKTKPFDLILMDMQMPVMDGYEAVKIIRQFEDVKHAQFKVPILALTAHGTSTERNKCLEIGCTDYLSKPVSKNALLNRMQELTVHA
jgi:signal transduction histidine kinase/CheY-like chemotaxis protein